MATAGWLHFVVLHSQSNGAVVKPGTRETETERKRKRKRNGNGNGNGTETETERKRKRNEMEMEMEMEMDLRKARMQDCVRPVRYWALDLMIHRALHEENLKSAAKSVSYSKMVSCFY